jgi:ankyrin repeat protein
LACPVRGAALRLVLLCALLPGFGCERWLVSKEVYEQGKRIRKAVKSDPARVNAPFEEGRPPLEIAIWNHHRALIAWLYAHGADPNVRDQKSGRPVLQTAVFADRAAGRPILRELLRRGADVGARAGDGRQALHIAAETLNVATAALLLDAGADPNAADPSGATPLHLAATPQPFNQPEEIAGTICLLVERGADPNAHETSGATPLFLASLLGHGLAVETLLSVGAEPNEPGAGGWTPLHVAAAHGKTEAVHALIRAGADVDRRDDLGRTPLWVARHAPAVTANANGAVPVETKPVVDALTAAGAHALGPDLL